MRKSTPKSNDVNRVKQMDNLTDKLLKSQSEFTDRAKELVVEQFESAKDQALHEKTKDIIELERTVSGKNQEIRSLTTYITELESELKSLKAQIDIYQREDLSNKELAMLLLSRIFNKKRK
jgi:uncharacterized coiled-coil protein SlyX